MLTKPIKMSTVGLVFLQALLFGAFVSSPSHAQSVVYASRTAWSVAVPGAQVEDFESYKWTSSPLLGGFGNAVSLGSNTYVADHRLFGTSPSYPLHAPYLAAASQYLSWQPSTFQDPSNSLLITFNAPVTAFAIDFGQFYGWVSPLSILLGTGELFNSQSSSNSYSFFGVSSSRAFTSVRLSAPVLGGTYPVIDNLSWGTSVVPEPSTYALVASGLVLLAAATRGRRRT